jgi:two-component system nitrate/nitrite response regulator NarL
VIRILIVDDHHIVRYGLRARFSVEADFEVVGEASDGLMALELLTTLSPDVVLLDLHMPSMDGLSVLQAIRQSGNSVKVVLLTASQDKSQFVKALKLGCRGIMNKQILSDNIVECIRRVNSGESWLDLGSTTALVQQFESSGVGKPHRDIASLSRREREIVNCVAHGLKNKQIGETLLISVQTVKNHLHNIFDKLRVSDRLELALYALHRGLGIDAKVSHWGPVTLANVVVVSPTSKLLHSATVEEGVRGALVSPPPILPLALTFAEPINLGVREIRGPSGR